jgi:hypothetical protein
LYPRYAADTVGKLRDYWGICREARAIFREVMHAPDRSTYSDLSLTAPSEDEFDALDLYRATNGGEAAVAPKRREDALRAKHARANLDCVAAIAAAYPLR